MIMHVLNENAHDSGGKNSCITVETAISLISCFTVVQDAETITGSMYLVRCISVVQNVDTSHACVGYDGHNDGTLAMNRD